MNPIKNIEIKNFKSIRHQKIDGCKRINIFIGYPNVGKSNILEAISLFGLNDVTPIKSLIRVKELPTIFFNGFIEDELIILLNNNIGIFGSISDNKFSLQFQSSGKTSVNPVLNPELVFIFDYYAFGDRPSALRGGYTGNKEYVIKKYDFKSEIEIKSGKYSSLQYPHGENIFSILQTNKQLREEAKQLFEEYALELLYDSRAQVFTILKRTDNEIFTVPYELVAATLQRLIFYKAAMFSNQEAILVFEEPEAHMFPPYVRKFTTDVVFDKTNQFFIATHSPYVLDAFMEEAPEDLAIYLVYYENGETKVKLMSERDMDEVKEYGVDLFYNLESYLKHGQVDNA